MNPPSNNVDKYGFLIPPSLDEYRSPHTQRRRPSSRLWKWALLITALVLVGVQVARSPLVDQFRAMLAANFRENGQLKLEQGDISGALADFDHAVAWQPSNVESYKLRADARLITGDRAGAAQDLAVIVELEPRNVRCWQVLSSLLMQLQQHREAVVAASRAVELMRGKDPQSLNSRAYARALAQIELPEAFEDIELALSLAGLENGDFLDTRGYLHYLLGRPGEALTDLDRAIDLKESELESMRVAARRGQVGRGEMNFLEKGSRESLAVIFQHRGLVHQQLGNSVQAQSDLRQAVDFGYNPAKGVL